MAPLWYWWLSRSCYKYGVPVASLFWSRSCQESGENASAKPPKLHWSHTMCGVTESPIMEWIWLFKLLNLAHKFLEDEEKPSSSAAPAQRSTSWNYPFSENIRISQKEIIEPNGSVAWGTNTAKKNSWADYEGCSMRWNVSPSVYQRSRTLRKQAFAKNVRWFFIFHQLSNDWSSFWYGWSWLHGMQASYFWMD
jgi:hypothetical protein